MCTQLNQCTDFTAPTDPLEMVYEQKGHRAMSFQSPSCKPVNAFGSKFVFQSVSIPYLMFFTSPVLLSDFFRDASGFSKTPLPPGKNTLHLFRQL